VTYTQVLEIIPLLPPVRDSGTVHQYICESRIYVLAITTGTQDTSVCSCITASWLLFFSGAGYKYPCLLTYMYADTLTHEYTQYLLEILHSIHHHTTYITNYVRLKFHRKKTTEDQPQKHLFQLKCSIRFLFCNKEFSESGLLRGLSQSPATSSQWAH